MKQRDLFIADLHAGHNKILEFESANRPYKDIRAMEAVMIKTINHYVNPCDRLWMLGDIHLGSKRWMLEFITQLNGKKILIRGNHDKQSVGAYEEAGIEFVVDQCIMEATKTLRIKLSHFPYKDNMGRQFHNMPIPEKQMWLVHGHVHSQYKVNEKDKTINVGWDVWGKPVSKDEILRIING